MYVMTLNMTSNASSTVVMCSVPEQNLVCIGFSSRTESSGMEHMLEIALLFRTGRMAKTSGRSCRQVIEELSMRFGKMRWLVRGVRHTNYLATTPLWPGRHFGHFLRH